MSEDLPQGADITIRTSARSRYPAGTDLVLERAWGDRALVVELVDQDRVQAACTLLGEAVRKFAEGLADQDLTPGDAAGLLESFAGAGRGFVGRVLRHAARDMFELQTFFREACPDWASPDEGDRHVPTVHCVSAVEHFFPWELLPLFDLVGKISAADYLELAARCRAFVGLSAIVERQDPDRGADIADMVVWDRLKVRMMYNWRYPGARAELGFFRFSPLVALEGPFPRAVGDPTEPTFARQLLEPTLATDGRPREYADDVVHIACHCETDGRDGAMFRLADDQRRVLDISLDLLWDEFGRHWAARPRAAKGSAWRMPLLFLNACGSAPMNPAGAASMMLPFYQNGNAPIVGTVANVPDRMAARMSQAFYTRVFEGWNVGEALHKAKWDLLQTKGNPLGILYSVHAFAGMRLLPVRAEVRVGGASPPLDPEAPMNHRD